MANILDKFEKISKVMTSDENRQARLLQLEKIYNQALEHRLVNKPSYDIPDILQMETFFFTREN
jgi:hypothetical protein